MNEALQKQREEVLKRLKTALQKLGCNVTKYPRFIDGEHVVIEVFESLSNLYGHGYASGQLYITYPTTKRSKYNYFKSKSRVVSKKMSYEAIATEIRAHVQLCLERDKLEAKKTAIRAKSKQLVVKLRKSCPVEVFVTPSLLQSTHVWLTITGYDVTPTQARKLFALIKSFKQEKKSK